MILSLAARKMEKNFRGVIEKGYPRLSMPLIVISGF